MRVLAAMSGGVDSATAAARAVDAGHEVTGVHLALSSNPSSYRTGARGCCTLEDARDARRAADVIGIPFSSGIWPSGFAGMWSRTSSPSTPWAAPRTPACAATRRSSSPRCSTGRWRSVSTRSAPDTTRGSGGGILRRAVDPGKDQSYVLAVLTSDQLSHAMFPLGDTPKTQVRAEAARRGLAVADKPDSHDVCFIADGDTKGFLAQHLGRAPGRIVDQAGAVLGEHQGAYGFTVGQRKGLRVGTPASDGRPRYVLDIEPVTRTVTVGPAEGLDVTEITATRPVWTGCAPQASPWTAWSSSARTARSTPARPGSTATRYGSGYTSRPAAWPRGRPPCSTPATPSSAAPRSAPRPP